MEDLILLLSRAFPFQRQFNYEKVITGFLEDDLDPDPAPFDFDPDGDSLCFDFLNAVADDILALYFFDWDV